MLGLAYIAKSYLLPKDHYMFIFKDGAQGGLDQHNTVSLMAVTGSLILQTRSVWKNWVSCIGGARAGHGPLGMPPPPTPRSGLVLQNSPQSYLNGMEK